MKTALKKTVCFLLLISLLSSLFCVGAIAENSADETVAELNSGGKNAEVGKSYSISSLEDFLAFAEYVGSGKPTDGAAFYLKKDINLAGEKFTPISSFAGIFDGCGFALLNLTIAGGENNAALFSAVDGEIRNLGITGSISGGKNAAGFAANLNGRISNCWCNVVVNGTSNIGGIAANSMGAVIENCCNYGKISGGGIAGKIIDTKIDNCYYAYYTADCAVSSMDSTSSADIHRFASSPTMCITEEEISIGDLKSEDVTELLNAWIASQTGSDIYRSWQFDISNDARSRVGGRYPSQLYPGYVFPEEPRYIANASMTTLYEMGTDAEKGACYSISSAYELACLAEFVNEGRNTEGATFFLTADISIISADSHYKGESWVPIGNSSNNSFKGVFDGQGYVITELLMNNSIIEDAPAYAGLFGYVNSPDAVIKNVAAVGSITDAEYAGGIVAVLMAGTVENSWYDGNITAKKSAGGIAGCIYNATIQNCAYFGTASSDKDAGGIAGTSYEGSAIRFAYYSNENASGTGSGSGSTYLAIAYRITEGEYILTRSINITDTTTIRLLNALNYWVDTISMDDANRHWTQDSSAASIARIRSAHPTQIFFGEGKNAQYLEETPQELERKENPYNIIYTRTATMTELYESQADAKNGGNYSISTPDEMWLLSMFVEEGHSTKGANFYLTDDIYLTTQGTEHAGAGWVPIGTGISHDFQSASPYSFFGNFDGCGFTVYGLYIVSDFLDFAGLFGRCRGSTIKNLGVCGEILGDDEVGGIVGRIEDGEIINCWSSVVIQASTEIGGITGHIVDSTVRNCANYGFVITTLDEHEDSGGIVGSSFGNCEISNCYYLYNGSDAMGNSISSKTSVNDVLYFHYDVVGDQSCTLEHAISIEDITSDDLLTVLNAWVYAQSSDQYCTWHMATSLQEIPGANGYYPVLLNSTAMPMPGDADYCGDYEATATMSALYSTKSDGFVGGCYSISNTDDLLAFRKYVNEGYKTEGIIFFLTRDIDMGRVYSPDTGLSWTPVGTAKDPFKGIFDGQGYTLKNIYITSSDDDQGFFGHVSGLKSVVKNLGITGNVSGLGINTAAICADFDFGTIANCWTACAVEGGSNVGGIIGGGNMGTIVNCANYGVVIGASAYGAIAGFPVGTELKYCYHLYASCQNAYQTGSTPRVSGVTSFNGIGAACILKEKINVEGTETKNALSALKLYVDAHPEANYCYWDVATTEEYYIMGVTGFPVLVSASGTMGEKDYKTVQATYNGNEFYSVVKAINAANDTEGGGDVTLAVNVVLNNGENSTLDDDVRLLTGDYSLVIKSVVKVKSMQQLLGTFILKEGGSIYLWDDELGDYKLFMYSKKNADPTCNSEIYSTESVTFSSMEVDNGTPQSYNLSLQDGEFIVNSTLDSGNPHKIPAGSTITVDTRATFNVSSNARIRTTGGNSSIMNGGKVKIGNATLNTNGGKRMVGVFEDDGGVVSLPYVYRDGYTLRGWSDGINLYPAGSKADIQTATTLTAQWKIGDGGDPYPGDDYYTDQDDPVYSIPITVIQSDGGTITPDTIYAAKGENMSFSFTPKSGYYIKNVLVDGESVTLDENNLYNMVSISRPHTIIALFATLTNVAYYDWSNPFEDIKSDDWCYDNVRYVSSAGLFNGTTANTFSPTGTMTRDMVVVVLWRLAGCPVMPDEGQLYPDVPQGNYAYDAVRWANYFGIVKGYYDGTFGYKQPVTREQLVTFLYRFSKNYAGDNVGAYDNVNILGYTDVLEISKGMTQPFQWAIGAGIVNGTTATTLSPKDYTTRAQVSAIFSRYCNRFMNTVPVFK